MRFWSARLSSPINPSSPNILGTIHPSLLPVNAGSSQTYIVSSPHPSIGSVRFTYSAGTKSCRFDTSVTTNPSGIPIWTKSGRSTGATCEAKITAVDMVAPFNYTVEFTMR